MCIRHYCSNEKNFNLKQKPVPSEHAAAIIAAVSIVATVENNNDCPPVELKTEVTESAETEPTNKDEKEEGEGETQEQEEKEENKEEVSLKESTECTGKPDDDANVSVEDNESEDAKSSLAVQPTDPDRSQMGTDEVISNYTSDDEDEEVIGSPRGTLFSSQDSGPGLWPMVARIPIFGFIPYKLNPSTWFANATYARQTGFETNTDIMCDPHTFVGPLHLVQTVNELMDHLKSQRHGGGHTDYEQCVLRMPQLRSMSLHYG